MSEFCGPVEKNVSPASLARRGSSHHYQANVFASYLLMPLDDVRRQIDPRIEADLEKLGACARRYNVSLIAATLKWLEYTERRAVLVVSRDGFILWARSSTTALKTGAFFRTSGDPIPIPTRSLAAQGNGLDSTTAGLELQPGGPIPSWKTKTRPPLFLCRAVTTRPHLPRR